MTNTMKLNITNIEMVEGKRISRFYKFPMFIINDTYVMSSVVKHNIDSASVYDLNFGENVVKTKEHNGRLWIAPMREEQLA